MEFAGSKTRLRSDVAALCAVASVVMLVHFALKSRYGFHRDELQLLDDARHLQWGFVAYPPLTAFCGRVAIALFGISPAVFRLPAAIVNSICMVLVGLIARELGGRRLAQIIAALAVLPVALAFSSILEYNTFDLLAWCLAAFFTARVLRSGDVRNWVGVGVAVGLGVLSKYSIAFLVVSLLAALALLPSQRRHFRSRYFWWGALAATVIAAPNLIWLAEHHFVTLQMEHAIHARDVRMGRASGYFADQLKITLFAFPLAFAGVVALVRSARFRLLSAFFLGPLLLFALVKGRGYYMLPAYPALFAAGGVALERVLVRRPTWVRSLAGVIIVTALVFDSVVMACVFLPMWPVASKGWNWQMAHMSDLQDEVGWPELVAQVAAVRDGLPAKDHEKLAVFANNYGEAGALALYGPQYGLPVPISTTNTLHSRGYGPFEPETVIFVGERFEDVQKHFEGCSVAARVEIPYGVRNEESVDHPEIIVCHRLRGSWPEVWAKAQEFG